MDTRTCSDNGDNKGDKDYGILKKKYVCLAALITGGTGWTTLADETNGVLLTIKTSLQGDILYTPLSKPTDETKSLAANQRNRRFLGAHYNIGKNKIQ